MTQYSYNTIPQNEPEPHYDELEPHFKIKRHPKACILVEIYTIISAQPQHNPRIISRYEGKFQPPLKGFPDFTISTLIHSWWATGRVSDHQKLIQIPMDTQQLDIN